MGVWAIVAALADVSMVVPSDGEGITGGMASFVLR